MGRFDRGDAGQIPRSDTGSQPLQSGRPAQEDSGPASIRLAGRAAKCQARTSSAASRLSCTIASLSGMRLVEACVVPELLAK